MSVTIQLRGDTAANWTSANPILAQREPGFETDTGLYKIGNGVTAWNSLPYAGLRGLDEATVLLFPQMAEPAAPAAGKLAVYAKHLAGRMLLRQKGPSGLAAPLQPSFFQNMIAMIGTNTTTAISAFGTGTTNTGTLSHPVFTEAWGLMVNFASAATANAGAGIAQNLGMHLRGTLPGGANGFFYAARVGFPDATYNESGAGTGSRIFLGLSDQATFVNALGSVPTDSVAGNACGFLRRSVNGGAADANWRFATRDGVGAQVLIDTGLPFVAGKLYDVFIFCPPLGDTITWRIDDLTDGLSAEGSTQTSLPQAAVLMRAGVMLWTVNAVTRNLRLQRLYTENDR